MSNKIIRNGKEWTFKSFVFPGGEIGIKLTLPEVAFTAKTGIFAPANYQTIISKIRNSNDIMELVMLVDALRRIDNTPIRLLMPYVPYSRQDRVCDEGESFSLKAFANLINFLNFESVCIIDPHSHVCDGVFNNLQTIRQLQVINSWTAFLSMAGKCDLISPDTGSNKKISQLAGYLGRNDFVRADKLRDLTNGNIKETIVYCDDFKGRNVLCVDDICDGGRTFIELSKVCRTKNCGKFILYVTHGIFSKGLEELFNNGIDEIWTTDSLYSGNDDRVKVFKLEEHIEIK